MPHGIRLERLEDRQLLSADVVVSLSGNEIVLTGDAAVTNLSVVYDPASEIYAFRANPGVTFADDGSLPGTILFTPNGNDAALAPDMGGGWTWANLGDYVGTEMTSTSGTAITLGNPGAPASNFGTQFDVADPGGGKSHVTIDDAGGPSNQGVAVTASSTTLGSAPVITYGGAALTGLTIDTSDLGGTTVDVTGASAMSGPLALVGGAGGTNAVNLGDANHAVSDFLFEPVTISSTGSATDLTIDDSAQALGALVSVTAGYLAYGPVSSIDYSTANLSGLTFDAGRGGYEMDVAGTPALSGPNPMTLNMGTPAVGAVNAINLGNADDAASTLGNATITGTTCLTIDDSADATSGQSIYVDQQTLTFGSTAPVIDYSGATLTSAVIDAGSGGTTVTVHRTPAGLVATAMVVDMGTSPSNMVQLGSSEADSLGNVTLTGDTGLVVDDSNGSGSWTIGVAATTIGFSNGATSNTFDFGGATLSSLSLATDNSGGNAVDVTGTPSLPSGVAMRIGTFGGSDNAYNLGDATHAASRLGDINLAPSGDGTTLLTIDDSAGASGGTVTVQSSSVKFDVAGPTFDYTGASFASVILDASDAGGTTAEVDGSPSASSGFAPIILNMGTGNSNSVNLGGPGVAAGGLGDVTVTTAGTPPANGSTRLTVDDADDPTGRIITVGAAALAFACGPTFTYCGADLAGLTLDAGTSGGNAITVTGSPRSIEDHTGIVDSAPSDRPDAIAIGDAAHPSSTLAGDVWITGPGAASLTIDDSGSTASTSYRLDGAISAGAAPVVSFCGATGLTGTTLKGSSGGDTWDITGTPGGVTTIDTNPAGGRSDAVIVGGSASGTADLVGAVTVHGGGAGGTSLVINDTADLGSRLPLVSYSLASGLSDVTGISASTFAFGGVAHVSLLPSSQPGIATTLTVDFSQGNPLPAGLASSFDFIGLLGASNELVLQGELPGSTPFDSEVYSPTPNQAGAGVITLRSGPALTTLNFGGLTPIIDSVPASSYTFTPAASVGTIAVTDGPTAGSTRISDPSPSPSFEWVAYSNKANVTIDDSAVNQDTQFLLNNPAAAAGQASLTVKLGGGDDTVIVSANPAGVAATIDGGVGSQVVTVAGAGLAAGTSSSNFSILGGTGPDILRLNAQGTGTTAALTPGTPTSPAVATFGTGAGRASMAFTRIGMIQDFATNHAPTLAIPTPLPTIATWPGRALTNVPVATFTDADLIENAASYQATIDWGDGTAPTTGAITAVPGTAGLYIISGSHAYLATGNHAIGVTLTDLGGTFNSTLANAGGVVVPVTTQLDAIAAVGGGTATASVVALRLASTSALPATAGTPATGTLAVFSNANGPTDPAAYYALINWGDGTGLTGAAIVADPNVAGDFDIRGTHTYAAPGTYAGTIELFGRSTGQSLSIPLSATAQAPTVKVTNGPTRTGGVPTGPWNVATVSVPFFLGSPGLDYRGYTASVGYGDGSPTVTATLGPASLAGATAFRVMTGGHVYATGGNYTLSVTIRDGAGVIVGTGAASVRVTSPTPVPPPAPALSWGRLSPQSDSGVSNRDGITNVTTPTFVGGATPGAVIRVYEARNGSSAAPLLIASGVANASGTWSATVVRAPLADGSYRITARASNGGGIVSKSLGTVVIDTVSPVITDVAFNRLRGEMVFSFRDNLSGVFLPDLSNGANYQLSATPLNNQIPVLKVIIPTGVNVTPGAKSTAVDEAAVFFNQGIPLRGGHYTIQVSAAGITDVAGNGLNGRFYGSYPSGNPGPGSNYVALFTALPRRTLGAFPIQAGSAKPQAVPAIRSLARVETVAATRSISAVQAGRPVNRPGPGPANLVDRAIASLAGVESGRLRV